MKFTNSSGQPITATQFAFAITVQIVGGAVALVGLWAFTVLAFSF